jgi:GMP synthase (glutamine-hydrolysing)
VFIYVTVQERESYYQHGPSGQVKARLEQASGEPCLIVPYQEFSMRTVRELGPRAIAMSGFGGHFQSRKVEWFFGMDEVLHEADLPIICFCGSHQLLGFSYSRDLRKTRALRDQPMRKLTGQEDLPRRPQGDPAYDLSRYFVADGFYPITKVKDDPLFAGLPKTMIMRCAHYCEVKKLPPGFELLATSGHCKIEAMRHLSKPLYGTQFHPEAYEKPFLHGRTLLRNFARIVDRFWRKRRG